MPNAIQTGPCSFHRLPRAARLAAALLPLPGLLAPIAVHAQTPVTIAICSGGGERAITLPARDAPPPRPDDRQGCAHFVCPRERADGSPTDDDEE
jgi:hypothetical protein